MSAATEKRPFGGLKATESPLKQVNKELTPRVSKFASCWDQLTTDPKIFNGEGGSGPTATATATATATRYFSELFCLKTDSHIIVNAMSHIQDEDMTRSHKMNMTLFFKNAVEVLKNADHSDTRRANVVESLIPFFRNVFSRKYSNFEVITLLAGSLEASDSVFTDLVSAMDSILADTTSPIALRHRTLQLALTLVCLVNQGSINAYFLRRDLFSTLVKFMTDDETSPFAFESALLLGLLANYRKYEARNPYLVRIEDFVDEIAMGHVIALVAIACQDSQNAYISITDDGPPSFVASLTSFVWSFSITNFFKGGFGMSLPPIPVGISREGNISVPEVIQEEGSPKVDNVEARPITTVKSPRKSGDGQVPPKRSAARHKTLESNAFAALPPEVLVILLPFYDLLNSNKAFCGLVFAEPVPSLPPVIFSLASYIFCHAAASERARAYSRLMLITMIILVEEGDGKLTGEAADIRLCRQRLPMLPFKNERRPPIAAMLDCAVIYLRHNLHKKLDVETYSICLRLIQRLMQQLKQERVRIDYDWVLLWRALLSLGGFIVSKISDLRLSSSKVDILISQIFIVLSYSAYWGEHFFPDTAASVSLHYELLHSDSILEALSDILGISTLSQATVTNAVIDILDDVDAKPPNVNRRDTPLKPFFGVSPRRNHFYEVSSASSSSGAFVATECVSNIRSSISFFSHKIEELRVTSPDPVEPDQVMRLIELNLGGLELIDSAAMGDLVRYSEGADKETFFKNMSGICCIDTLELLSRE